MSNTFIPSSVNRWINIAMLIVSVAVFVWFIRPISEPAPTPQDDEILQNAREEIGGQPVLDPTKPDPRPASVSYIDNPTLLLQKQHQAVAQLASSSTPRMPPDRPRTSQPQVDQPASTSKDIEKREQEAPPQERMHPESELSSAYGDRRTENDSDIGMTDQEDGQHVPSYVFDSTDDYVRYAHHHDGRFFAFNRSLTKAYDIGSTLQSKVTYTKYVQGQLLLYSVRKAPLPNSPMTKAMIQDVARKTGLKPQDLTLYMLLPNAIDNQLRVHQLKQLPQHAIKAQPGLKTCGHVTREGQYIITRVERNTRNVNIAE